MTLGAAGLTKRFGRRTVFADLTFCVSAGKALVLRGGNGAGKTTLLRCLQGAQRPDSGEITLDGERQRTSSMGYWGQIFGVLDDFSWFPELTVGDHLRLHDPRVDPEEALARFDVADLRDRIAVSLSSGQLRRAALATTLVRPWTVLLLDEPEQRLDQSGLARLLSVLNEFQREGRTVVVSTHSHVLQSALDGDVLALGQG